MTEAIARMLQGAELLRHSTPDVVSIFLASRTPAAGSAWGCHFGTLAGGAGVAIQRSQAAAVVRRAIVA